MAAAALATTLGAVAEERRRRVARCCGSIAGLQAGTGGWDAVSANPAPNLIWEESEAGYCPHNRPCRTAQPQRMQLGHSPPVGRGGPCSPSPGGQQRRPGRCELTAGGHSCHSQGPGCVRSGAHNPGTLHGQSLASPPQASHALPFAHWQN